jgi:hypothetical protein
VNEAVSPWPISLFRRSAMLSARWPASRPIKVPSSTCSGISSSCAFPTSVAIAVAARYPSEKRNWKDGPKAAEELTMTAATLDEPVVEVWITIVGQSLPGPLLQHIRLI